MNNPYTTPSADGCDPKYDWSLAKRVMYATLLTCLFLSGGVFANCWLAFSSIRTTRFDDKSTIEKLEAFYFEWLEGQD